MKELTEHEKAIRDKDTKDLTISELKEKIRIVDKEAHCFDEDIFSLAKQTHAIVEKRNRRIKYSGILRANLNAKINYEKAS
ncbi:MAG: hypothetical protein KAS32_00370 [Candidatus Peribacteraceae bacterium]|nr:hypothetical protein [Candidatus Peribacteraceae bacterium]